MPSDFELYTKAITVTGLGVNYGVKEHLLQDGQWYKSEGLRHYQGIVSAFPKATAVKASGHAIDMIWGYQFARGTDILLILASEIKVYRYDWVNEAVIDITPSGTTFHATRDYNWTAVTFNDVLYMSNRNDGLYKFTGSGTLTHIPEAPNAWFIGAFREHLIALGDGYDDGRSIAWAAEFSETDWTPAATNDAGGFDFTDSDVNMCAHELGDEYILYRRQGIHVLNFIGGDLVFSQRPLVNIGAISPYAVAVRPGAHYVMGMSHFYRYTGGVNVELIDEPINSLVYTNIDRGLSRRTTVMQLEETKEIAWQYYNASASTSQVIHNHKDVTWGVLFGGGTATVPTSWIHPVNELYFQNFGAILGGVIDSISEFPDNINIIIDEFDAAFALTGGQTTQQLIVDPEIKTFTIPDTSVTSPTSTVSRYLETGDIFLGRNAVDWDGNSASFMLSTLFRLESLNLEVLDVMDRAVNMFVGVRKDLNDAITWSSALSVKSYNTQVLRVAVPMNLGLCRWARLRFDLINNASFSLAGFQFVFSPMGTR